MCISANVTEVKVAEGEMLAVVIALGVLLAISLIVNIVVIVLVIIYARKRTYSVNLSFFILRGWHSYCL